MIGVDELGFYDKAAVLCRQLLVMGRNGSGELAVHIPDGNGEGMQASVVGDAIDFVFGDLLQNLEGVLAGFGKGDAIQNAGNGKGLFARFVVCVGDRCGLALHIDPGAFAVTLDLKGKVRCDGGLRVEGLCAGNIQANLGGFRLVDIFHHHIGLGILADNDRIAGILRIGGLILRPVAHSEVCTGSRFSNGNSGILRKLLNLQGLAVADGNGEAAPGTGGDRLQPAVTGMDHIKGLVSQAFQCDGQFKIPGQHGCGNGVAIRSLDLLGDLQIAVASGCVDESKALDLPPGQGDSGEVLICSVDGLHLVGGIVLFCHSVFHARCQAGDVNGLICGNGEFCLAAVKGQGFLRALLGTDQLCGAAAAGDHKGKGPGSAIHGFRNGLGDLQAGSGLHHQLTVVAQDRCVVVLSFIALFHDGPHHIIHGAGLIVLLCPLAGLQQLILGALGDDPVVAVLSGSSQRIGGNLYHHPLGAAGFGINIVFTVAGSGSTGTGVPDGTLCIGIDHGIRNVVVALIFLGGFKVGVGIVRISLIFLPIVGIEDVVAVGILMLLMAFGAGDQLLDIVFMDILIQSHLIDQADGAGGAGSLDAFQLAAVALACQLHFIGQGGDQGGGDCPGQGHVAGGDLFPDPDDGIHHIGVTDAVDLVGLAQEAVGLVDVGRTGRSGLRHALIPEAQVISAGIGIPAGIVAVLGGAGVGDLSVAVSLLDQRLCVGSFFNAQAFLNGTDEFVAQLGGILNGAACAGSDIVAEGRAGEILVADDHALDIGDFHVFTDVVNEGNIAIQVMGTGVHQGGGILGLEDDLIHDGLEGRSKAVVRICRIELVHIDPALELLAAGVHIIILLRIIDLVALPAILEHLHLTIGLHGIPHIVQLSTGLGRIHHAHGFRTFCRSIAIGQGVEQHILAVVILYYGIGIHCGKLSQERNGVAAALLICVAVASVCNGAGAKVVVNTGITDLAGSRITCKIGVAQGGLAVTHQHHNGHTGSTGLDLAILHDGVSHGKLLHSLIDAVLGEGAGGAVHAAGNGLILSVLYVGSHFHTLVIIPVVPLCRNQIDTAGACAVTVQGQDGLRSCLLGFPVTGIIACVQHNTDPVVVVQTQQLGDGLVGFIHQLIDRTATIVVIGAHGAGQVQNKNRVGGNGGIACNGLIGCHNGQGYQEIVLFRGIQGYGSAAGRIQVLKTFKFIRHCGKDGFIRPDHTCILGRQRLQIEELLPAVVGSGVRHLAVRGHCMNRQGVGRDHGQHHQHCRQEGGHSLFPIIFSHLRTSFLQVGR